MSSYSEIDKMFKIDKQQRKKVFEEKRRIIKQNHLEYIYKNTDIYGNHLIKLSNTTLRIIREEIEKW